MKKKIVTALTVIFAASGLLYFIGTGFTEQTSVVLTDYTISEDGSEIVLTVSTASSMGYVRDYADKGGATKPHYLHFYSAFGGLNGSWGSKNEFVLELAPDDTEIYFYRGDGGYDLVLKKNKRTNAWEPASSNIQG